MPSGTISATLPAAGTAIYRPRRPARTLLHKVMRENLETYLTGGDQTGEFILEPPVIERMESPRDPAFGDD